jgi:chemotaxis protein CheC
MMQINELEQDALGEIFNIGVGLAADVLSQMVNESVRSSVPVVEAVSHEQANSYFIQRIQRPLCAIRQTYVGDVTTDAILMFPEANSLELVRVMVGDEVPAEQLSDMEQDAMAEIGNIILNAVISSLSKSLDLAFDGSLPDVSVIDAQGVFTDLMSRSQGAAQPSTILALTIDFELETRQINGYLAFLLDIPSGEKLLASLARYIDGA